MRFAIAPLALAACRAEPEPVADSACDAKQYLCDELDDDCDALTWYADADGDGFGDSSVVELACDAPAGFERTTIETMTADNTDVSVADVDCW